MAKFGPTAWACPGKNGQTCYEAHQSQLFLYQKHFLKVSSKSDEPHLRYPKNGIFWDQIWPNLGQNHGHAQAIMGKLVVKLISLKSFHTKNISWKFHQNLMNQIWDILKMACFGTKYDLIWAQIMGMPGQEWASVLLNSSVTTLKIPRSFPESFSKISWTKLKICCKMLILDPIPPTAPPTFALFALYLENQIFPRHAVFTEW